MINPDFQLQSLRSRLRSNDTFSDYQIDRICDTIARDIDVGTQEILSTYLQQAVEYAQSIGADRFVEEAQIIKYGNGFKIVTISGDLDYSTPAVQNRDNLLNGKEYRVIPITDTKTVRKNNLTDLLKQAQTNTAKIKESSISVHASPSCFALSHQMVAQLNNKKIQMQKQKIKMGETRFRTVSKNQNPREQWVIPERNLDLTTFVEELNQSMERQIDDLITSTIAAVENMI